MGELTATSLYFIYYRRTLGNLEYSPQAVLRFSMLLVYHVSMTWFVYARPASTFGYTTWRQIESRLRNYPALLSLSRVLLATEGKTRAEWRNRSASDLGIHTISSAWATINVVFGRFVVCLGW